MYFATLIITGYEAGDYIWRNIVRSHCARRGSSKYRRRSDLNIERRAVHIALGTFRL